MLVMMEMSSGKVLNEGCGFDGECCGSESMYTSMDAHWAEMPRIEARLGEAPTTAHILSDPRYARGHGLPLLRSQVAFAARDDLEKFPPFGRRGRGLFGQPAADRVLVCWRSRCCIRLRRWR